MSAPTPITVAMSPPDPGSWAVLEDGADGLARPGPHQALQVALERALHVLGIHHRPDQQQDEHQQRRERKDGVVGERRGHGGTIVVHELPHARFDAAPAFELPPPPRPCASIARSLPLSRSSASSVATSSPRASCSRPCWLCTKRRYGAMASLTRSVDWPMLEMNLPGESVAEPTADLRHLALEISLRLAALAGDDPESADGERGGQQQPGDVRRGAGDHGRHQGPQPDRAGLGQRRGGEDALHLVGDGLGLRVAVVAAHHVARHPPTESSSAWRL